MDAHSPTLQIIQQKLLNSKENLNIAMSLSNVTNVMAFKQNNQHTAFLHIMQNLPGRISVKAYVTSIMISLLASL